MRASWKVPAMPARQMASGVWPVTDLPSRRTSPPSGESRPETTLSSVVLPEPLGPTRPITSPRLTSKETPSRAARPPKWRLRLVTSSRGARRAIMPAPSRRGAPVRQRACRALSAAPLAARPGCGGGWRGRLAAQAARRGLQQVGEPVRADRGAALAQEADDAVGDEEHDAEQNEAEQDAEMAGIGDGQVVLDQQQRHDAQHRPPHRGGAAEQRPITVRNETSGLKTFWAVHVGVARGQDGAGQRHHHRAHDEGADLERDGVDADLARHGLVGAERREREAHAAAVAPEPQRDDRRAQREQLVVDLRGR